MVSVALWALAVDSREMNLASLSRSAKEEALVILEEQARRVAHNKIETYYPETGLLRRELYAKHLQFFAAGKEHRERLAIFGNRCGKTTLGSYELTLHLTGKYPDFWPGHRFDHPIMAWMAGDTRQSNRDIQQHSMLGPPGSIGTGMIPGDLMSDLRPMPGVANSYEQVHVKHVSGGTSILQSRSFDQGREAFQGTEREVIWLDEEPPIDVYTECLTRTMATGGFTGGLVMVTFTPLRGMSELVCLFLGDSIGKQIH